VGVVIWGLVARADERGLGRMTHELYRALHPDRTLVVREPGAEAKGFPAQLDRYPGAAVVTYEGGLAEAACREFLAGLDVVYLAETAYDPRFYGWASEAGCATVLAVMPEFYNQAEPPPADALWVPTPWRMEHLPAHTQLVPVPVADDRFPFTVPERDGPLRVLHVAGHRAAADRNGTTLLLQALRSVRQPMRVRMLTQDRLLPRASVPRHVDLDCEPGGRADYWTLYEDADVLVLPRRYGGLCLPAQEAMASGLAVVMSDCAPNDWWPTLRVPVRSSGSLRTAAGELRLHSAMPRELALSLDRLAVDGEALRTQQEASLAWAEAHRWSALEGIYRAGLGDAAGVAKAR